MGFRIRPGWLVTAALLAGCATSPKYENHHAADAACIKGDFANVVKFFADGEAHVLIKEIDGVATRGGGPYCMTPGKHRLGISAHNNYETAQDYVEFEFDAGRKYWLRANLRGISFVFQLLDVTDKAQASVTQFSLKAGSAGQAAPVPIFIPARR